MVGNCGDVTLAFFPLFFLQIVDILAVACHTQTVSSDFPSAQTKDSTLRQSYAALNLMLCTVSLRRAKQAYKRMDVFMVDFLGKRKCRVGKNAL